MLAMVKLSGRTSSLRKEQQGKGVTPWNSRYQDAGGRFCVVANVTMDAALGQKVCQCGPCQESRMLKPEAFLDPLE